MEEGSKVQLISGGPEMTVNGFAYIRLLSKTIQIEWNAFGLMIKKYCKQKLSKSFF
ncbi:MAG: hypothetical protein K0R51_2893 [Cytophagaceae bacterium]|jgi:hypothetical protein|nr:hypothetical protein [Cytophagaceae bacterium]